MRSDLLKRHRINRYIMECKCNCRWVSLKIQAELIDTLWNVNDIFAGEKALKSLELIDTLWNVNDYNLSLLQLLLSRINRYIMECK